MSSDYNDTVDECNSNHCQICTAGNYKSEIVEQWDNSNIQFVSHWHNLYGLTQNICFAFKIYYRSQSFNMCYLYIDETSSY